MKKSEFIYRIQPIINIFRLKSFDTSSEVGRSYERYRLIALSGSSSIFSKIIVSIVGLISVPLTINYLGKEQFGLWMVVSSLVVWLQLTDFGIINGLVNALAEANGRNDKPAACSYISTAFYSITGITLILFIPIFTTMFIVPWDKVLNIDNPSLINDAKYCFGVVALFFFVNMPLSIGNKALTAYQKGYLANITQIVSALCSLLLLIIAIIMGLNLIWLVALVSAGPIFGNIISWILLYRDIPWLRLQFKEVSRKALHRVAKSSVPLFLFQIGALLVNQSVNIIIAHVGTLKMVSDYNVIFKIYIFVFTIGISLSAPFYPAIREAYEKNETNWVLDALNRVLLIRLGVLLLAGVLLLFTGDLIIQSWIKIPMESQFGFIGWLAFLLSLLFAAASSTLGEILTSLDDIWSQIKIVFLSAIIIITSMFLLIPKIGLAGIFCAVVLSTLYPIIWSWRKLYAGLHAHVQY